jgi:hypothetical protein
LIPSSRSRSPLKKNENARESEEFAGKKIIVTNVGENNNRIIAIRRAKSVHTFLFILFMQRSPT